MLAKPTSKDAKRRRKATRGFGLVELITVVTVMAIISAISMPVLYGMSKKAEVRRCQRIAQEISMIANSAAAAGSSELLAAHSVAQAVEMVIAGVKGAGVFAETEFRVPNVDLADQSMAAHHLTLRDGTLIYDPEEP